MIKNTSQTGQALLLVLLSVAVVLTISLSVISQSISDIAVTTKEEESLRAFSAAEAGVEEALIANITSGEHIVSSSSPESEQAVYEVEAVDYPNTNTFIYPSELNSGESATIWVANHDEDGSVILDCKPPDCDPFNSPKIMLYWGVENADTVADVSIWYLVEGEINVKNLVFSSNYLPSESLPAEDPDYQACAAYPPCLSCLSYSTLENCLLHFSDVLGANDQVLGISTGDDGEYVQSDTMLSSDKGNYPINDGDQVIHFTNRTELFFSQLGINKKDVIAIKVRLLLNNTPERFAAIATGGPNAFPSQGKRIQSTGSSGDAQRRIQIFELYPDYPSIFDSAITSQTNLSK